jgi:hypothetical protein
MIAAIFSGGVSTDPYFNLTTLLLSTTATNGQQNNTFQDSSTNNFTITRNPATGPNAPTQGTFSPFSQTGWSGSFGNSSSWITTNTTAFSNTASTWTIEAWVYMNALPTADPPPMFGDMQAGGITNYLSFGPDLNGKLQLYWFDGAAKTAVGNTVMSLNTWNHVAISVNAGAISLFVNGTLQTITGTSTLTNRSGTTGANAISRSYTAFFNAYISNLRVTTTAVYSGSFTPSTTPLTAITGTQLLLFTGNRFVDANTQTTPKTLTITTNSGYPAVVPFSPFLPTSAWSASTVGGSGYFDGTGDYLTANDNPALELGSSNFCLEFMYYPTSSANTDFVTKRVNAASYGVIIVQTGLALNFWLSSSGSSWDLFSNAALGSVTLNAWNHLAIYRIGNAWYSSLNGTITTLSASLSGSVVNNAANWNIGGNNYTAGSVIGYLSNFRLVIGSSVYTSTSAPIPTAPLTAVTNTQLLLNFTNAGIYDATAKNVLETVGNAQASTAITPKWGTTSMLFNSDTSWLQQPASVLYGFGTGNFTVECWFYLTASPTTEKGLFHINTAVNNTTAGYAVSTTTTGFNFYAAGTFYASTTTAPVGQWNHLAYVKNSGTVNVYLNGSLIQNGSKADSQNLTNPLCYVGLIYMTTNGSLRYLGYMQDFRVTRFARYTANFTPPTAAFPVQ